MRGKLSTTACSIVARGYRKILLRERMGREPSYNSASTKLLMDEADISFGPIYFDGLYRETRQIGNNTYPVHDTCDEEERPEKNKCAHFPPSRAQRRAAALGTACGKRQRKMAPRFAFTQVNDSSGSHLCPCKSGAPPESRSSRPPADCSRLFGRGCAVWQAPCC